MATKTAKKTSTTKASPKPTAKKVVTEVDETYGSVSISPNLPPIPGNTVTFYAKAPEDAGRLTAKISGPRGPWFANLTEGGDGDLRVSKIIEVPGTITVEFFNDGKSFAKGSWEV